MTKFNKLQAKMQLAKDAIAVAGGEFPAGRFRPRSGLSNGPDACQNFDLSPFKRRVIYLREP
jgi:hypothetical protein